MALGTTILLVVGFFSTSAGSHTSTSISSLLSRNPRCPVDRWSAGEWVRRPPPYPTIAGPHDVYKVSGFTGCASSKESQKHLANDNATWWDWRAKISTYDWVPARGCDMAVFDKREFILRLVKRGGWLFVGDTFTEAQFYSLSCMLYPYVRHGPSFYTGGGWKHSWPQFLYLNQYDPWVQSLLNAMPIGFRPDVTPIASYLHADLLFSRAELADVAAWTSDPTADPATVFGDYEILTKSALDWLAAFDAKLPAGRYDTIVLNSGQLWLQEYFKGLEGGMPQVMRLWRVSMNLLAARLVAMLERDKTKRKVVIFRSAMPGHEGCFSDAVRNAEPLTRPQRMEREWYNWKWLPQMNDILEGIIKQHAHPRMHFLRLDRPASLRTDAHILTDCTHFVVGSGILEDWTIYINHFVKWEVDYSR